ncbi:DUF956 family protein [Liquorilactobacillus mali]|uniref:ManO family protein n=1 Tax=Liquorilactobacillus mali KCTC 3596 = DSM 20444 TaxID=1046596 RepID=J1F0X3_9LACO|nr:DUF956 family protein [Liquorilactobacillus mali]EJE97911.1 hypothetical protein LMA_08868 [Liquorilactobacillus mali KCTC 3596 = DSM 20444]KRN08638.1 hypothetical protein FD00_GL002122 [Liquorilactobacillus mali KCTC 3596 = DSM 20444]MDC7953784.1 DUF956 family protein [Liquorilactobacillus mali]QFQ75652.1 DUF956 family protein [Liquorilactobacillus mali]
MVKSINTKVDLVIKGNSHMGMADYGKIMIGDKGFEFYDIRNVKNFIQIPWEEVDVVVVSVLFKGMWIPRYALKTKRNGLFTFSSKNPKRVLRAIRKYVDANKIVKSLTFFQVLKRAMTRKKKK